ncbi:MAG: hypothetical protein AAFZ07_20385 [Actinomycetota bacterium]
MTRHRQLVAALEAVRDALPEVRPAGLRDRLREIVEDAIPGEAGRPPKVTTEECRRAYREHGSYAAAARDLGVVEATVRRRLQSRQARAD